MSMVKLEHLPLILILDLTEVHLIAGVSILQTKMDWQFSQFMYMQLPKSSSDCWRADNFSICMYILHITYYKKIEDWTTFYCEVFFACNNLYY